MKPRHNVYVGCRTVWTRQNHRRYRLRHFTRETNSSATSCAATCRMQPNCSVYELATSGDGVTCTYAANYDETSYDVVPLVTSFTRKEHDCRLRGNLKLQPFRDIRIYLLGPFYGAIAVPSVTRCRCRCCRRCRGHRCAGGVRQ